MSFAARLIHELAIERPYSEEVGGVPQFDEYNQPITEHAEVASVSVTEEVRGFISPKSAREIALVSQAGAAIADVTIFLPITADLTGADRIHDIATGDAYEVMGVNPYRMGRTPHLEVDARRISTAIPVVA